MNNIRWKVVIILAVLVLFAGVGVYPLVAARYGITKPEWLVSRGGKLGLALKGGGPLVARVQTDGALPVETESSRERLREQLTPANIGSARVSVVSSTDFRVE